jgi:hypothetical protein
MSRVSEPNDLHDHADDLRERRELRALIERKRSGMDAFARWEAAHPATPDLAQVFASLGAVYDLIPPDQRRQHEDLERADVRRMHACLGVLS